MNKIMAWVNKKRIDRLFYLLLCTLLLISCSISQTPITNKEVFIEITAKLRTIQKLEIADSSKAKLTKALFSNRKISISDYRYLQKKYMQNAKTWKSILSAVKENLEKTHISNNR